MKVQKNNPIILMIYYSPEDKTGVSYRTKDGYGADKRIEDQVLKMAVDMADRYKSDMSVKDAAIKTLGKVTGNLRKAMAARRHEDTWLEGELAA